MNLLISACIFAWVVGTISAIRTDSNFGFVFYTLMAASASAVATYLYIDTYT